MRQFYSGMLFTTIFILIVVVVWTFFSWVWNDSPGFAVIKEDLISDQPTRVIRPVIADPESSPELFDAVMRNSVTDAWIFSITFCNMNPEADFLDRLMCAADGMRTNCQAVADLSEIHYEVCLSLADLYDDTVAQVLGDADDS